MRLLDAHPPAPRVRDARALSAAPVRKRRLRSDYNDLPLDSITDDTICANLMELLARHKSGTAKLHGAPSGAPVRTVADPVVPATGGTASVVKFAE